MAKAQTAQAPALPEIPDDLRGWRWIRHPGSAEHALEAPGGAFQTRMYLRLDERPFEEARGWAAQARVLLPVRPEPAQGLTATEAQTLSACESTIAAGLKTFVAVGEALLTIREQRLYLGSHPTFEAYCGDRWQMTGNYARRLIGAAEVVGNLQNVPIGTFLPESEAQARPLAALPAAQQADAWQRAIDTAPNGKVTAKHVAQTVAAQRAANPLAPLLSSDSEEWYTPQHIVQRVLRFFDDDVVDLDPCSPTADYDAAPVPARAYYTKADDGLSKAWRGDSVFLNPPYGDQVAAWVARLIEAYTTGEIVEAIALLPARTDTAWFQPLHSYPRCFIRGRLRFDSTEGLRAGAPFPSVLVYLGTDPARFREIFGDLGKIALHPDDAPPPLIEEAPDAPPPLASAAPAFDPLRDVDPDVLSQLSQLGYDFIGTAERGIARWYTFRDPGAPDGALTLAAGEVPAFLAERAQYAAQRQAAKTAAYRLPEPWQAGAISAAHPTTHAWRLARVGWEAACGQKSAKSDLAWGNTVTCSTCQRSPLLRPATEPARSNGASAPPDHAPLRRAVFTMKVCEALLERATAAAEAARLADFDAPPVVCDAAAVLAAAAALWESTQASAAAADTAQPERSRP